MKKNYSFLVVLVYLFFSRANAQTAHPDFHDGLLSFKTLVDSSVSLPLYPYEGTYPYMDSLIAKYGITNIKKTFATSEDPNLSGCFRVQFDSIHLVDSFVQDIKRYGFIEFVSKRPIKRPFASPNDPKYNLQWSLHKIMADSVWNLLPGTGKEIILAVIDGKYFEKNTCILKNRAIFDLQNRNFKNKTYNVTKTLFSRKPEKFFEGKGSFEDASLEERGAPHCLLQSFRVSQDLRELGRRGVAPFSF